MTVGELVELLRQVPVGCTVESRKGKLPDIQVKCRDGTVYSIATVLKKDGA